MKIDVDEVADKIIDALEESDCSVAEAVAILEITKYQLIASMEVPQGTTLQ